MHNSAANAVLTKARSKYGSMVKCLDYNTLCACDDVRAVVAYLKNRTGYSDALSNVNSAAVFRGNLEKLIHSEIRGKVNSLCDFQRLLGINSFDFTERLAECRLIITRSRYMLAGLNSDFIKIDNECADTALYNSLMNATSLKDIGAAIEKTVFADEAMLYKTDVVQFQFPLVEAHLYRKAFDCGFRAFEKQYGGKERQELCELLAFYTEITDLQMLHRCLNLPPCSDLPRRRLLIGKRCHISEKRLSKLLSVTTEKDFFTVLNNTRYGKLLSKKGDTSFKLLLRRELKRYCEKQFRFSKYPSVVLLAFILILECEYSDLATVIEGVRYGCDSEYITDMLITQQPRRCADGN